MTRMTSGHHWTAWLLAFTSLAGCDSNGPNERPRGTIAVLNGLSVFTQPELGRQHTCVLSGCWPLPAWPTAVAADTATLALTRELLTAGSGNLRRDTLLSVSVSWVRIDSTFLMLTLGDPIGITFSGALDSAAGSVWRGVWPCPSGLPFGSDPALLTSGYEPDSLEPGVLVVARVPPVD